MGDGMLLGTAKVRAVTRDGTSNDNFRIYLFDIKMNSGKNFSAVKSIYDASPAAVANLILEDGKAVLKDGSFKSLIFPVGKSAIKTVTSNTDYIYRTSSTVTFANNGSGSITVTEPAGAIFPYGVGNLGTDSRADIMVLMNETAGGYNQGTSMEISSANTSSS